MSVSQKRTFSFLEGIAVKTEFCFLTLDDKELDHVTGGMFRGARWATKGTRMGDGTVEGQQWYKGPSLFRVGNRRYRPAGIPAQG
jgi:bacteriocin-like protein